MNLLEWIQGWYCENICDAVVISLWRYNCCKKVNLRRSSHDQKRV